jgi:hypothetical protein
MFKTHVCPEKKTNTNFVSGLSLLYMAERARDRCVPINVIVSLIKF